MIAALNRLADGWWEMLSVMTLQSSLFLLLALLLLHLWRRQAAATLQLVALLALIKLYIPPVLFGGNSPDIIRVPLTRMARMPLPDEASAAGLQLPHASVWFMLLWLCGACGLLLLALMRNSRLQGVLANARPVPRELLAGFELPARVRVLELERGTSPFVTGIFAPRIVLPASWRSWPESTVRTVLAHECTHLSRWDLPLQLLQRIALALHWFNPLVWLLQRRLDELREMACDDHTMNHRGFTPQHYARDLLYVAREVSRAPSATLAAVGDSSLRTRFRYLLGESRATQVGARARVAMGILAIALIPFSWNVLGGVEFAFERTLPIPAAGYASLGTHLVCPCSMSVHGAYCGEGEILVAARLPDEAPHGEVRFTLTVGADGRVEDLTLLRESPDCLSWSTGPMADALRSAEWQPAVSNGRAVERRLEVAFRPGVFGS